MPLLEINSHPSRRQLRVFAAGWLVLAAALGWLQWRHGRPVAAEIVWAVGLAVPLGGQVWPAGLRWVYVGLSLATYPVGFAVSAVVLAAVFYGILTPIGLALRLFRHDALGRRFDRAAASYWRPRPPPPDPESYFRQH